MRLTIDIMIGLMVTGVLVAVVVLHHERGKQKQAIADVQSALELLQEKTDYHTALESAMQDKDTLMVNINAAWFGDNPPANPMLEGERPWIDLAPPGDLGVHPPDPIATRLDQASFWYNPTTGVFRARVQPHTSEAKTLALYNKVNHTYLEAIEQIPDSARTPIAMVPGKSPAKQYASMANRSWSQPQVKNNPDVQAIHQEVVLEGRFEEPTEPQFIDESLQQEPALPEALGDEPIVTTVKSPSEQDQPDHRPTLDK